MRGWDHSHIEKLKARGMVVDTAALKENNHTKSSENIPQKRLKNIPKEDFIQRQCFTWFKFQYPVWDIFLSVPKFGFSGMFIEMKAGKNTLTESQVEFMDANDKDYLFKVCYSVDEFKKEIDKYLK